jgi:hypothetical protein
LVYAELAMIDENLIRGRMSASEIASATARRKAIYLELHPETAATQAGGSFRGNQHEVTPESGVTSFVEATAAATGQAESTVRQNARRGRLGEDVLRRLAGTSLDTGVGLDSLLALSEDGEDGVLTLTPEKRSTLSYTLRRNTEQIKMGRLDNLSTRKNPLLLKPPPPPPGNRKARSGKTPGAAKLPQSPTKVCQMLHNVRIQSDNRGYSVSGAVALKVAVNPVRAAAQALLEAGHDPADTLAAVVRWREPVACRFASARTGLCTAKGRVGAAPRRRASIVRLKSAAFHAPFRQWSRSWRLATAFAASFSASSLVAYECGDRT